MSPARLLPAAVLSLAFAWTSLAAQTPAPAAPPPRPAPPPANWWLLDPAADGVAGISAERAYRELLSGLRPRRTVVVAIIDSGMDLDHPDLDGRLWVNEDEVPGNGRDDDGNGYVDDVHGWDFLGGPDGRDVHYDALEITRLYAACRRRFDGVDSTAVSGAGRAEHQRCQEVKVRFEAERARLAPVRQARMLMGIVERSATEQLKAYLRTDSLTEARLAAIPADAPQDVLRARTVYLLRERLADDIDQAEARLKYGLDPDFDPRSLVGDDYANPRERVYGNAEVEGPDPEHGTHVAGIVGGERDGRGVDGVASAVRLMVVRAVPQGDVRDKDLANAIRYAVDNGAQVVNLSIGKAYSPQKEVVDEAVRHADARGVLLVHSAGNESADSGREANYPTRGNLAGDQARLWIEVGASAPNADSLAARFSNYSRERVDVFAPGDRIVSSVPGGGLRAHQGTSMAAPVVSGLAALLMAYFPELSAAEVRQVILDSATRYPGLAVPRPGATAGEKVPFSELSVTGGVVNAYAAVQLAQQRARSGGGRR